MLRYQARATGDLPHEILLRVARGEPIDEQYEDENGLVQSRKVYPNAAMIIDAAKASAPFFAPKLAVKQITTSPLEELEALEPQELRRRLSILLDQLELAGISRDQLTLESKE